MSFGETPHRSSHLTTRTRQFPSPQGRSVVRTTQPDLGPQPRVPNYASHDPDCSWGGLSPPSPLRYGVSMVCYPPYPHAAHRSTCSDRRNSGIASRAVKVVTTTQGHAHRCGAPMFVRVGDESGVTCERCSAQRSMTLAHRCVGWSSTPPANLRRTEC